MIEFLKLQFTNGDFNEDVHFMIREEDYNLIKDWLQENCTNVDPITWIYEGTWHTITLYKRDVYVAKVTEGLCKTYLNKYKKNAD